MQHLINIDWFLRSPHTKALATPLKSCTIESEILLQFHSILPKVVYFRMELHPIVLRRPRKAAHHSVTRALIERVPWVSFCTLSTSTGSIVHRSPKHGDTIKIVHHKIRNPPPVPLHSSKGCIFLDGIASHCTATASDGCPP